MNLFLITAVAVGISSVLGTAFGVLIRKIPHKYNDLILGCASGIMLAAAIVGLILPAMETEGKYSLLMTVGGVLVGATLVSILDRITPHLHKLAGLDQEEHANNAGTGKVLLFISAIAIHKFPEGLAAGVSFGTENTGDILTVTGSIALQNIPEAMVIVAPLLAIGVTIKRTLLISIGIGVVSMLGMGLGYGLISITSVLMPFFLSFAGGTMLYVISDEMIPETHAHGFEKQATFSMIGGFLLVLILQKLMENAG
ncbi:MAG: ZIP family metal transporter [Lentisphaerae bacterium]|nr:ZIP family metal transporter [Lentisphaerota bacterium]